MLTQETQSQQQEEIHQLWLRCGGGGIPKMKKQKKNGSPFLMPYWLHIFEVSKFVTCWTRRDLVGEGENVGSPPPTTLASPPGPGTPHRLPDSPWVTNGGGHASAGVDIPGTVGIPGKDTVYTEAVLCAVIQGQLDQLRAGASEKHPLQKNQTKGEPLRGTGTERAGICAGSRSALGTKGRRQKEKSRPEEQA